MGDETALEISSSESDYSNSFIASDDDLENGLTWDSGESRPAAPSPPSTPSATMSNSPAVDIRRRLRPRGITPNVQPPDPVSSSSEDESDSLSLVSTEATEYQNAPSPVVSTLSDNWAEPDVTSNDSDVTNLSFTPRSPSHSPTNSHVVRSPDFSPPSSISTRYSNSPRYIINPNSPDYEPPLGPIEPPLYALQYSPPPYINPNSPDYEPPPRRTHRMFVQYSPESPSHSPASHQDDEVQVLEPEVIEAPEEEVVAEPPPQEEQRPVDNAVNVNIQPTEQPQPAQSSSRNADAMNASTLSEGDENSLCSICMDPLTNSGDHRVVCLKCGHIFGHSCLERWIKVGCNNGARRCPTCNKKACLKDIRVLYLPKVVPLDTVERDRLIREKDEIKAEKKALEMEILRCKLQIDLKTKRFEERMKELQQKYSEALDAIERINKGKKVGVVLPQVEMDKGRVKTEMIHSQEISKEGNCRVLAFNYLSQELVVSQPSGNTVFAGFGVRVLPTVDFQPTRFMFLHQKPIRDLAFHPEERNLLLSVSLDCTAKLIDLFNSTTVHTFKGENPLWSCCWNLSNPHLMLVGSQLGRVRQYDRRMMDHYLNQWENKENPTPVVALASAPCGPRTPFPQGGFFSCRLKGVYAFSRHKENYNCQELPIEGIFTSMKYDHTTQNLLTSTRPTSNCVYGKVHLNLIDVDTKGNICTPQIHTFNNGMASTVLARSTILSVADDSLVVAYNDSRRTVNMWSSKTGNLDHTIPIKEPVIDMTSVALYNNKCLLATLSDKRVNVYKVI